MTWMDEDAVRDIELESTNKIGQLDAWKMLMSHFEIIRVF